MKLLTLNTHSLNSENNLANCQLLCNKIAEELPDIVALQEVNQLIEDNTFVSGGIPVGEIRVKESNFAHLMQKNLSERKLGYQYCWLGMKKGYDRFDEGLAIFSKAPVREIKSLLLSDTQDYNNFKKRMALCLETDFGMFINCHMGWERDIEEPYDNQLKRINACQNFKKNIFLLGDFNVSEESEGYKKITDSGWYDTFFMADETCGRKTVSGKIDGWEKNDTGLRIDYIFSNKNIPVKESRVIFDGKCEPRISDHAGVMVTF